MFPIPIFATSVLAWLYLPVTVLSIYAIRAFLTHDREWMFPLINKTKEEYIANAQALIEKGKKLVGDNIFRIYTGTTYVMILPPKYTNEIKNNPHLDPSKFLLQHWHAEIPGFEPFAALGSEILHEVIKKNLTQNDRLAELQSSISEETAATLQDILTDSNKWHEVDLNATLLRIISRVAALVFLGPDLCRNDAWLDITANYTRKATVAARVLNRWPRFLIPYIHWFLPETTELRAMVDEARQIIKPSWEKRRAQKAAGHKIKFQDSLEWYEEIAQKKGISYDAACQQMGLSFSAIYTSTHLISQTILFLCMNPEYVGPLQEEIRNVLGSSEWKNTTLHRLKLMDSVLKETLRLKPTGFVALGRHVMEDVKLSDGTILPKGANLTVNAEKMWSSDAYKDPLKYDGYRFLRNNSPENESTATLVSNSAEHMGFGLGVHACPGRFFGAAEVKIVMSHLLLNYDLKLADSTTSLEPFRSGFSILANPKAKLMIRRREEQVHFC